MSLSKVEFLASRASQSTDRVSSSQARAFFLQCRQGGRTASKALLKRQFSSTSRCRVPPVPLSSPEAKNASTYCQNLLRQYDSPSYTLAAFIPPAIMPLYYALRAFNIEVSRVPDVTSNTTIAQMRYQFWRDKIKATLEGSPPEEPVLVLLAAFLNDQGSLDGGVKLTRTWFNRIITAREEQTTRPGFVNLDGLERYAENTYSALLYLSLSGLPLNSITADHIASHIGKAAGISTMLRGVPLLAFPPPPNNHSNNPAGMGLPMSRGQTRHVNLPLDVMSRAGVREEDVFKNGGSAEGLKDAVFEVATRASDHVITARTLLKRVMDGQELDHDFEHENDEAFDFDTARQAESDQIEQQGLNKDEIRTREVKKAYGILLGPAVSTQLWLDRLQKVDFDIFDVSLRQSEWKLPIVAWWRNRRAAL